METCQHHLIVIQARRLAKLEIGGSKGLSSHVSGERACNGHNMYIDSEILIVTKNSTVKLVQAQFYIWFYDLLPL